MGPFKMNTNVLKASKIGGMRRKTHKRVTTKSDRQQLLNIKLKTSFKKQIQKADKIALASFENEDHNRVFMKPDVRVFYDKNAKPIGYYISGESEVVKNEPVRQPEELIDVPQNFEEVADRKIEEENLNNVEDTKDNKSEEDLVDKDLEEAKEIAHDRILGESKKVEEVEKNKEDDVTEKLSESMKILGEELKKQDKVSKEQPKKSENFEEFDLID